MYTLYDDGLYYPAEFLLEWETFQIKAVQKIKTHILRATKLFFRKSCLLWNNVEKCGGAKRSRKPYGGPFHAVLERLHERKHTPIHTHTHTHTQICKPYLFFYSNNDFANAPQFYVIRTLSVFSSDIEGIRFSYNIRNRLLTQKQRRGWRDCTRILSVSINVLSSHNHLKPKVDLTER